MSVAPLYVTGMGLYPNGLMYSGVMSWWGLYQWGLSVYLLQHHISKLFICFLFPQQLAPTLQVSNKTRACIRLFLHTHPNIFKIPRGQSSLNFSVHINFRILENEATHYIDQLNVCQFELSPLLSPATTLVFLMLTNRPALTFSFHFYAQYQVGQDLFALERISNLLRLSTVLVSRGNRGKAVTGAKWTISFKLRLLTSSNVDVIKTIR